MGRYTFPAFNNAPTSRYVVVWDLQRALIECQRLEPAADLSMCHGGHYRAAFGRGLAGRSNPRLWLCFHSTGGCEAAANANAARSVQCGTAFLLPISLRNAIIAEPCGRLRVS
jgi:hypothetical protein